MAQSDRTDDRTPDNLAPWEFRIRLGRRLRRMLRIVAVVFVAWALIQTLSVFIAAATGG